MQLDTIEFQDFQGSRYGVRLSSEAVETISTTVRKAGRKETGGILIGRYDADGWIAEIVSATSKPPGSRSGFYWFSRSNTGLSELLKTYWAEGLYYLGEWHLHPSGAPTPSDVDNQTMRNIALDPAYQCRQPILLIIGKGTKFNCSISVTIFNENSTIELERVY